VSVAASLAENEYDAGDSDTALRLTVDVLATHRALNSSPTAPGIAAALANMATYYVALGRYDEARAQANEALELARGLRLVALVALSLRHIALVLMLGPQSQRGRTSDEYTGAARLFGFLDAHVTALSPADFGLQHEYDRALSVLRDAIGADDLTRLMAVGATMTEDEAIDQAHAIR
jgi:tetratricopeptide (TPR) repeat protein